MAEYLEDIRLEKPLSVTSCQPNNNLSLSREGIGCAAVEEAGKLGAVGFPSRW